MYSFHQTELRSIVNGLNRVFNVEKLAFHLDRFWTETAAECCFISTDQLIFLLLLSLALFYTLWGKCKPQFNGQENFKYIQTILHNVQVFFSVANDFDAVISRRNSRITQYIVWFSYCRLNQQSYNSILSDRFAAVGLVWLDLLILCNLYKLAALCLRTTPKEKKPFISPFTYQSYHVSLLMWICAYGCVYHTIMPCTGEFFLVCAQKLVQKKLAGILDLSIHSLHASKHI